MSTSFVYKIYKYKFIFIYFFSILPKLFMFCFFSFPFNSGAYPVPVSYQPLTSSPPAIVSSQSITPQGTYKRDL